MPVKSRLITRQVTLRGYTHRSAFFSIIPPERADEHSYTANLVLSDQLKFEFEEMDQDEDEEELEYELGGER